MLDYDHLSSPAICKTLSLEAKNRNIRVPRHESWKQKINFEMEKESQRSSLKKIHKKLEQNAKRLTKVFTSLSRMISWLYTRAQNKI